jgi:hypothetical protein
MFGFAMHPIVEDLYLEEQQMNLNGKLIKNLK